MMKDHQQSNNPWDRHIFEHIYTDVNRGGFKMVLGVYVKVYLCHSGVCSEVRTSSGDERIGIRLAFGFPLDPFGANSPKGCLVCERVLFWMAFLGMNMLAPVASELRAMDGLP